jgi:hypothetical protein
MKLFHRLWPRLWGVLRLAADRLEYGSDGLPVIEDFDIEALILEAEARGIPRRSIESWREKLPPEWVALAEQGRMSAYLLTWGLFRPDFYTTALDLDGPEAEGRWQAHAAIISEMAARAREERIEVAMVLLPNLYMYDRAAGGPESHFPFHHLGGVVRESWAVEESEIQRRTRLLAAELDLPYLDLTDGFRQAAAGGELLHFELDGHWNEHGHRVAADLLAEWLERERVFSSLP